MTLEELRRLLEECRTNMRTLHEEAGDNAFTDEQQARWAELDTQEQDLARQVSELEARHARVQRFAAIPGATESGADSRDPLANPADSDPARGRGNPWDFESLRASTFGRTDEQVAGDIRSRALDAIERMPATTDKRRKVLTTMVERFDNDKGDIARHVLIASDPEYMRAFSKLFRGFARTGSAAGVQLSAAESEAVQRAMSLTDAQGGFLVPQQLDPTLILTADGSVNPFRQIARKVTATGDRWDGVSAGNAAWSWDGEAVEVSDDSVAIANPNITIHKAQGFIPFSAEVQADAVNFTQDLGMVLAGGKDDLEAAAFATGSGAGQPFGIVTSLTGTASVVASAGADTFAVGDLYNVEEALPAKYRTRAEWTANKAIYNDVRQFGTSDSHALWERIGAGQPAKLLGYNAHEASAMDGVINATLDNFVLVLGDWQYYVIADRLGMTLELIPHLFGANRRPTGQRGFFAYYRTGADSVHDGAFRMLNVT